MAKIPTVQVDVQIRERYLTDRGDAKHLLAILEAIEHDLDVSGIPREEPARVAGIDPVAALNHATVVRVAKLLRRLGVHPASVPKSYADDLKAQRAFNEKSLAQAVGEAHAVLTQAGILDKSPVLSERIALLLERERRSVLDARQACAAAVDLVAARFEALKMVDAAAAARECATVARTAETAGYRAGVDFAGDEPSRTVLHAMERFKQRYSGGGGYVGRQEAERLIGLAPHVPAAIASGRLDGAILNQLKKPGKSAHRFESVECGLRLQAVPVVQLSMEQSIAFRRDGACDYHDTIVGNGTRMAQVGDIVACTVQSKDKDSVHEEAVIVAVGHGNHRHGDGWLTRLKRIATGGVVRPKNYLVSHTRKDGESLTMHKRLIENGVVTGPCACGDAKCEEIK